MSELLNFKPTLNFLPALFAFLLTTQLVRGQEFKSYEFAKPPTKELALNVFPKEPEAEALVLHEWGDVRITSNSQRKEVFRNLIDTQSKTRLVIAPDNP